MFKIKLAALLIVIALLCTGCVFTSTAKPTPKTIEMEVTARAKCRSYNSVGNEWSKYFSVNETTFDSYTTITIKEGDRIKVNTKIVEHESKPDVGTAKDSVRISSKYLDGFEVSQTIDVKENAGRYVGNVATWDVIYTFTPIA